MRHPVQFVKHHHPVKEMEQFLTLVKMYAIIVLTAALNWVFPLAQFVGVTLFLVAADLASGIYAARARREVIHSKGLRRTALKFCMYSLAIVGAHAMETVFFQSFPMVFSISAYIAVTEFWSVLENVGTITGTNVLNAVRQYFEKVTIGKK